MLPIEATQNPTEPSRDLRRSHFVRRFLPVFLLLLAILLLALVPPLVNVSRFKHRIVTSISTTLGRPVHLDRVSLNLLPLPGFTLENFVVEEDSHFGYEPIIRANSVRVTLRASSLWRRKVEFSRIALDQPSLNLVHDANGRWNFENLILQASQISAAPTAQPTAGRDPRFPYMEATGARINIKSGAAGQSGQEKLPFALTETDLALWLPTPNQWHLRLSGHPARTDTNASDTGTVELEGTFGRAKTFAQMPLDLTGRWRNAPLGEASLVVLGRDANLRGDLALSAEIHGTLGANTVKADAQLSGLRRADFVPQHPLDINAECQARSTGIFHAFHEIRCSWPPPAASDPATSATKVLVVTGDLPDIRRPDTASFEIGTPGLPASSLLNWLHVASASAPADETASGTLTAKLAHGSIPASGASQSAANWSGDLHLHGATLTAPSLGAEPFTLGDLSISSPGYTTAADPLAPAPVSSRNSGPGHRAARPTPEANTTFLLAPTALNLGGREPALLEGRFDANGYTLHLTGTAIPSRLLALAAALPQFGDGLPTLFPAPSATPAHIDLTASGAWTTPPTWTRTAATTAPPRRRSQRR
ncbi:MAG TPA: AsmA family protein [Granulicella sp.]|nr:AsmA family protein [Granulicella sp.]